MVGETLSPASSRNVKSGDSGVALTLFSFAFSCWYWIQAATSVLSALIRSAQNVMMPSEGSVRFLYSTRSCWRCVGVSLGKTVNKDVIMSDVDVCAWIDPRIVSSSSKTGCRSPVNAGE